jgi:DNA repair protein RadC
MTSSPAHAQTRLAKLPLDERPRERLLKLGPTAMADRELLAMVLRNGRRSCNAIDLATAITSELGSLGAVATADIDQLRAIPGMGLAKSTALISAFELGRRVLRPETQARLASSEHIAAVAQPVLSGLTTERSILLITDQSLKLKRTVVLSEGGKCSTAFNIRDVMHAVLRSDGCAFALAHNHPSGSTEPSEADRRATYELEAAANVVGLRFLDHLIVTPSGWSSVG